MKVAVMQPYFLPYIGYFQLMQAVDRFVVLDDVNYINRGWINRNRIPSRDATAWLTLPLVSASQNKLICDIDIVQDDGWKTKMARTVITTYCRAPQFDHVMPAFNEWLADASGNLSAFLIRCLTEVLRYLHVPVSIVRASSTYPKNGLRGSQRILDICRRENADTYVNASGGRELYDAHTFAQADVDLVFLQPRIDGLDLEYGGSEGPTLSILDLLMRNSPEALARATSRFDLLRS